MDGGRRVPSVVQTTVANAGLLEQRLPAVVVRARVQWSADRGGKNRVAVLPQLPDRLSPLLMLDLVRAQHLTDGRRQADHPRPASVWFPRCLVRMDPLRTAAWFSG